MDMSPQKDWTGNTQSVMATLNASNHSDSERETHDYYATDPRAVEMLLKLEEFSDIILEPACGEGHISEVLLKHGYQVRSGDLIDRGYGKGGIDFLSVTVTKPLRLDIVTNPPFAKATDFIEKALAIVAEGRKVAFFLRIQFLEGVRRRKFFEENPPRRVWVASRTLRCAKNGDFANATGNASTYCWFVWEKGYKGKPEIGWFN